MYDAPCSRVGHIYRKFAPFSSNGIGNYLGRVCNVNSFFKNLICIGIFSLIQGLSFQLTHYSWYGTPSHF